ncbi:hypothetical protein GCM10009547_12530 [Sporichthya brevicatena]|uniref:Transcriptional regulator, AbiEi antitoxin, Type IV TA system n=1 Tax=Sporichthya brevicatena TaxID=171442 RepID=A0ABN1GI35_9ACTN
MSAGQLAARAPLGTIRVADLAAIYAHPRQEARALERRGVLHRLAHGFYCAVPPEHDPAVWKPSTEAAAAGIATALYGDRVPVLTGLSAARVHRVLPRAIAVGFVAVPGSRRPLRFADRPGVVRFVERDVTRLDAELLSTDLGLALATTAEQTVLDLAHADPTGADADTVAAIDALWARCEAEVLEQIAGTQRMRATLARVREQVGARR